MGSRRFAQDVSFVSKVFAITCCLLSLAQAQDAAFQAPARDQKTTLVLNADYVVQWTTDWNPVDLWVFCTGSQYDGVGENGANLLYGEDNTFGDRRSQAPAFRS